MCCAGDADQLPPVSAGSFLGAAIDSGVVPVVDLREVFRQAQGSDIVKAAHAVHAGTMPPLTRVDPGQPSEVGHPAPVHPHAPSLLEDKLQCHALTCGQPANLDFIDGKETQCFLRSRGLRAGRQKE